MNQIQPYKVSDGTNYIGLFITFSCPRGCSYCINNAIQEVSPRKMAEGYKWAQGLNRLETSIPITFNGGEPLDHPDFFYIVNSLRDDLKVDMLTTLPYDINSFIDNMDPKRFERDLPYSSIRVTFHPEKMDLQETVQKVKALKKAGFDAEVNLVNHPGAGKETRILAEYIKSRGMGCAIKPFLGYQDGKLHGHYRYMDSCSKKKTENVNCRTSIILIDPSGDIYRCHADMFSGNSEGVRGNLFDENLNIKDEYTSCDNFGFCHPCDVQIKFDRLGNWGYTAVDIKGDNVEELLEARIDWERL